MGRAVRIPASAFCLAALLAATSTAWAMYHGLDAAHPAAHARLHPDGVARLGAVWRGERNPLADGSDPYPAIQPGCPEPRCGLRGAVHEIEAEP